MITREQYVAKLKAQLDQWDAEVAKGKRKAEARRLGALPWSDMADLRALIASLNIPDSQR